MRLVTLCASLLLALAGCAALASASARSAEERCAAPPDVWGDFPELPRARAALRDRSELTIVAFGSSSTLGVGASAPDRSYPARLQALLAHRFPGKDVRVLNKGVGYETLPDNLARLERDALATAPDLVIWQGGTNDALEGVAPDAARRQLLDGLARLRAAGVDVVVVDTQASSAPEREAALLRMDAALAEAAREAGVPLLPRHALMLHWLRSGRFAPGELLGPDGLHMTDASYRCLAERIADLLPVAGEVVNEAPPAGGAAEAAAPDLRGVWRLRGSSIVVGVDEHFPAPNYPGTTPRLLEFERTLRVVGQEGRRFWGTLDSGSGRESVIGILASVDTGVKLVLPQIA